MRVTVRTAGDTARARHELAFGYQNPTRNAYYVQVDEEPDLALLSASAVDATFRRPASDFRDRHLVRFDPDRAVAVDLATPERTLSLRHREGRWWIERPALAADEAAVRGLLLRIRDVIAVDFAQGATGSSPGLERPALALTVRAPGDTLLAELLIGPPLPPPPGTPSGEYAPLHPARAGRSGVLAAIQAADLTALDLGPADLRDRHLLDLAGAALDSLAIRSGERWVRGAASDSAWAALRDALPEWRVMDFLDDLAEGPGLVRYGLAPPRLVVRVKLRNGAEREVYLGDEQPDEAGVYAHRPGIRGVVVVPLTVRDAIVATWSREASAEAAGADPRTAPGGSASRQ
jgi:hypothetical protein